jgi:AsmA family protein
MSLTRAPRVVLIVAAVMLSLLAAAVFVERHLESVLVHAIESRTGRQITIGGPFEAHFLTRHPHLSAEEITVGNPPWMPPGEFAHLGRVVLDLQWRLSWPPFGIQALRLGGARLNLVRNSLARANWYLHEGGAGPGPPLIRSLSMPHARVQLHDERRHLEFKGTVTVADVGDASHPDALRISAEGDLNGRPATLVIDGDPLAEAQRDHPYHFSLTERSGDARLTADGHFLRPFDFRRIEGSFKASGPDLTDAYYLIGLHLPATGAFQAAGRLDRNDNRFLYHDLKLNSGTSDLTGSLDVRANIGGYPKVDGELNSTHLRLADLGARAAGKAPAQDSAKGLQLPDTALHLSGLRHLTWTLRLGVQQLEIGHDTLQKLSGLLTVEHGIVSLDHLKGSLAQGQLAGSARFDAAHEIAQAEASLEASDIQLAQLSSKGDPPIGGSLNGRLQLQGRGKSVREIASTLDGTVSAVVPHGTVRAVLAEAASLDLSAALGALSKSDKQTAIRCAVASFDAHQGVLTSRTLVVDTDKALITGSGTLNAASQALDLTLKGRPKHPNLKLHSALSIRGTLTHPELHLSKPTLLGQSAAAAALGALLTPVAAVLAFVSPGLSHDADCAALVAQATPQTTPHPDEAQPH